MYDTGTVRSITMMGLGLYSLVGLLLLIAWRRRALITPLTVLVSGAVLLTYWREDAAAAVSGTILGLSIVTLVLRVFLWKPLGFTLRDDQCKWTVKGKCPVCNVMARPVKRLYANASVE